MFRRFHRGGLLSRLRHQTKKLARPIGRALRAADTVITSRRFQLVVAVLALFLWPVSPVLAKGGAALVAIGATQEFLNSDLYRLMYGWGLLDKNGGLRCQLGTSGLFGKAVIVVDSQCAQAGVATDNSGTDFTLYSKVIPANTLVQRGDMLEVYAKIKFGANGNNKTVKIIIGGTTLFTSGVVATNGKDATIYVCFIREATKILQVATSEYTVDGVATAAAQIVNAAEDLSTPLTLKLTGNTGTASDVVAYSWRVTADTTIVP